MTKQQNVVRMFNIAALAVSSLGVNVMTCLAHYLLCVCEAHTHFSFALGADIYNVCIVSLVETPWTLLTLPFIYQPLYILYSPVCRIKQSEI